MSTFKIETTIELEDLLDVSAALIANELDFSLVGGESSWYKLDDISITPVSRSKPTTFRVVVDVFHEEGRFQSRETLENEMEAQIQRMA